MKKIVFRAAALSVVTLATVLIGSNDSVLAYSSVSVGVSSNEVVLGGTDGVVPTTGSTTLVTGSHEVTVNSGCSGYKVFVSTSKNSADNDLHPTDESISNTITSVSGENTLSNNEWGIKTSDGNVFSEVPKYSELGTINQSSNPAPLYTSLDTSSGTPKTVYYGAKIDSSLIAGEYHGTVLYTAIMDSECYMSNVSLPLSTGVKKTTGAGYYEAGSQVTIGYEIELGYHFDSWSTESDLVVTPSATNTDSAGTATLTAPLYDVEIATTATPNQYTVVFDKGDATGAPSISTTQITYDTSGKKVALAGVGTMKKTGYVFQGWSHSPTNYTYRYGSEALIKDIVTNSGKGYINNATITLYPIWVEIIGSMQDFTCSDIEPGEVAGLTDTRENSINSYSVTRFPLMSGNPLSGLCFMTSDLALGSSYSDKTEDDVFTVSTLDSTFDYPTVDSGNNNQVEEVQYSSNFEDITYRTANSTWNNSDDAENRQFAIVNGSNYYSWGAAMVSCPKGWRLPNTNELNGFFYLSQAKNGFMMEYPYNFQRNGTLRDLSTLVLPGKDARYWSNEQNNLTSAGTIHYQLMYANYIGSKSYGINVRCINDAIAQRKTISDISTMQEVSRNICLNSSLDESHILTDTRDQSTYKVMRAKDGNCWMTENLKLIDITISADESNFETGEFTIPASSNQNFYMSGAGSPHAYQHENPKYGVLYDYYALSAGAVGYNHNSTEAGILQQDICPKGWRVPTGGYNDGNDFERLIQAYGGSQEGTPILRDPNGLAFQLSGAAESSNHIFNVDYSGFYWSSTTAGYSTAKNAEIGRSWASPSGGYSMYYGMAIRCIVKM